MLTGPWEKATEELRWQTEVALQFSGGRCRACGHDSLDSNKRAEDPAEIQACTCDQVGITAHGGGERDQQEKETPPQTTIPLASVKVRSSL